MLLSPSDEADVTRHKSQLVDLLHIADQILVENPQVELCPRLVELLAQLEAAFAGQSCPSDISLLSGGLAEDDYRSPSAISYINTSDSTPRDDWGAISPQLLRACEDALVYLEPPAFCYVLPAYLRQYLLRPDFMCTDSIFSCMSHTAPYSREKLAPLKPAQRFVVEAVMNEYRLREQKINGEYQEYLLPWEYDLYLRQGNEVSAWTFTGNLALDYAARAGIEL